MHNDTTWGRPRLPGSLIMICTGQGNNGKTEQLVRLLTSRWPDGTHAIAPFLLLVVEASGEGTASPVIADEALCLTWPVATFEEAQTVLRTVFPDGRGPLTLRDARLARHRAEADRCAAAKRPPPPPPAPTRNDALPVGGIGVDSASTLLRAQKTAVRTTARDQHKGKVSVSGRDLDNDQKRIAAIATGPAQDFVDLVRSTATRNRGIVVCLSVHTRAQIQHVKSEGGEAKSIAVGEAPDFGAPKELEAGKKVNPYSDLWQAAANSANVIWHLWGDVPDFSTAASLDDANAPGRDVTFGAVTMRGIYPGLGAVLWPKRQGGDGWLAEFDRVPRVWSSEVVWPGPEGERQADGDPPCLSPGHLAFRDRVAELPGGIARGYDGSPDAGLVFELCLARLGGAS